MRTEDTQKGWRKRTKDEAYKNQQKIIDNNKMRITFYEYTSRLGYTFSSWLTK